jgi:hypothetical protein
MIYLGQIRGVKFGRRTPPGPLREAYDAEVVRRSESHINAVRQATTPARKSFWQRLLGKG